MRIYQAKKFLGQVSAPCRFSADAARHVIIVFVKSEGHIGKSYNLNGPSVLSGSKVASIWSQMLGKEIHYPGEALDEFEVQMRQKSPSWAAFDMRMMFQGYLERGFVAGDGDIQTLTKLLGHAPRRYEDFAREAALEWQKK